MYLAIGIPAYRSVMDARLGVTLFYLGMARPREWGLVSMIVDSCFVSHARNQLLWQAMHTLGPGRKHMDWLLMIDSDVYHHRPDDVINMIQWAKENEKPVIAAPVLMRGGRYNFVSDTASHPSSLDEAVWLTSAPFPVQKIGSAFMAIDLAWMRGHMPCAPWFTTSYPAMKNPNDPPVIVGEDYSFCTAILEAGGSVWCDPRIRPFHVKGEAEGGFRAIP